MKYTGTYERSVQIRQITMFNIPEDNYACSHRHESLYRSRGAQCKVEWWHCLVFWLAINICREPSVSLYRTVEVSCALNIGGSTSQFRCRTTKLHGVKAQETVISAG